MYPRDTVETALLLSAADVLDRETADMRSFYQGHPALAPWGQARTARADTVQLLAV